MAGRVAAGFPRQEKKGAYAVADAPFFLVFFLSWAHPVSPGHDVPPRCKSLAALKRQAV